MLSLHQLRCFIAAYELGSFTAAANSSATRSRRFGADRGTGAVAGRQLFRRAGRGVVPTRPPTRCVRTRSARCRGRRGARTRQSVSRSRRAPCASAFRHARLYIGAGLVADVLERHPGLRVELIGQNSSEVQEELRRGRLEAAMIACTRSRSEGMAVRPVAREELVYISADPARLASPGHTQGARQASLVLPETTWRAEDSTRVARFGAAEAGPSRRPGSRSRTSRPRSSWSGWAGRLGRAAAAASEQLRPRLAPTSAGSRCVRGSTTGSPSCTAARPVSPRAELVTELAVERIHAVTEPVSS